MRGRQEERAYAVGVGELLHVVADEKTERLAQRIAGGSDRRKIGKLDWLGNSARGSATFDRLKKRRAQCRSIGFSCIGRKIESADHHPFEQSLSALVQVLRGEAVAHAA